MTNGKVSKISDLSEVDRKLALEKIKTVLHMLGQCDCYLRDYMAGTQNAAKMSFLMFETEGVLSSARDELSKISGFPSLGPVSQWDRSTKSNPEVNSDDSPDA